MANFNPTIANSFCTCICILLSLPANCQVETCSEMHSYTIGSLATMLDYALCNWTAVFSLGQEANFSATATTMHCCCIALQPTTAADCSRANSAMNCTNAQLTGHQSVTAALPVQCSAAALSYSSSFSFCFLFIIINHPSPLHPPSPPPHSPYCRANNELH